MTVSYHLLANITILVYNFAIASTPIFNITVHLTQTNDKIEGIQSSLSGTFIKKMKLLGRSLNSDVVNSNESFKEYDAIYVSSFTKSSANKVKISTSIFAFSEDINVGDKITLLEETNGTSWQKSLLTISSDTSFTISQDDKNYQYMYTTVIGINL